MTTITTSTSTRLDVRKLTARIGAEVTGVGPALELDPETVTAIRAALNEHKALVFRGISLDDEGQQRFARYFGELTTAHPTVPAVDGAPNVLPVDSEDGRANHWHTDVTFVLNPPQASTLRSIIIPPYGGETLIANAGAAYRDLPGRCAPSPTRCGRCTPTTTTTRCRRRAWMKLSERGARCSSRPSTRPSIRWSGCIR